MKKMEEGSVGKREVLRRVGVGKVPLMIQTTKVAGPILTPTAQTTGRITKHSIRI
jgi:hypothetical protein